MRMLSQGWGEWTSCGGICAIEVIIAGHYRDRARHTSCYDQLQSDSKLPEYSRKERGEHYGRVDLKPRGSEL